MLTVSATHPFPKKKKKHFAILHNIFFCSPHKKENHMCLAQMRKWWQNVIFWINYKLNIKHQAQSHRVDRNIRCEINQFFLSAYSFSETLCTDPLI